MKGLPVKLIGIEEHFVTDPVMRAWQGVPAEWRDPVADQANGGEIGRRLADLADERIADMDSAGLDIQVVSLTAPGVQSQTPADAAALAREANDALADAVRARPDRLQGLATLPTPDPAAAVKELSRAVSDLGFHGAMLFGRTRDRNADDPAFWPIYEAAAHHRAPLYLHPQAPVPAVRGAIYSGFGEPLDTAFAAFGLGWHYEAGVQVLRLILAGVFDRFPELQVVTGHWGEVVLFYLDRIDGLGRFAKLQRPVSDYFRTNISITPSGVWSQRYLRWAKEVVGVERILFSTDYPYRFDANGTARRFLEEAELTEGERAAIAHGNWERMVAAIRR